MSAISIWWNSKPPIIRFLVSFFFLMIVFYIFYYSPFYENNVMNSLLSHNDIIAGPGFQVSIKNGCDGIEATALYICAIVAFPFVKWKYKISGLFIGVLVLTILNLFRIAGLYVAGIHWSAGFEFLHLHGGVIIFTLIAILLWLIWLGQIKKYIEK
jgi:exosortase/archaeosortase family protein